MISITTDGAGPVTIPGAGPRITTATGIAARSAGLGTPAPSARAIIGDPPWSASSASATPAFGVSLGFGYGNIGWVPLAPFERFRPWYGRGYAGRNLAIVNNTNIASVYRNARFAEP